MKKKWIGKYGYDYEEDSQTFSFEINVEYDSGSFEGSAYEEEFSGLTSDLVHVKGFIESDMISLILTYPYKFEVEENGDTIIDKKLRGHQVIYEGYFNDENGSWSGDWEIKVSEEHIVDGVYEFNYVNGPWEMKLQESFNKD